MSKESLGLEVALESSSSNHSTMDPTPISKDLKKDKKRRDAQMRQALYKKIAPIKEQIKKIEADLEKKEMRSREIQEFIANPRNYDNKEAFLAVLTEEPIISREVSDLEEKWEKLHSELEAFETEFSQNAI
jgi:ATP-binding cassette subfamily F protein 3